MTLSKSKGHVFPGWLKIIHDWMLLRCKAGAAALERGGKQQHLHLQIILRMHIHEQDMNALRDELKTVVGWRRGDGSGVYCSVKEFAPGQSWSTMLGYLHKDQTQPHFDVRLHNIDPVDIVKGIAEWQTAKLSYEDGMIMLSRNNMFQRLSTFRMNSDPESDNTFLEDMTDLLNSRKYMICSLVITSGQMRLGAAESMWKLIKGKTPMTTDDTRELFFAFASMSRPGAPAPGQRYFDAFPEQAGTISTPMRATDGFLSEGAARPDNTRASGLSPFVSNMLAKNEYKKRAQRLRSLGAASSSIELGPDSPRSVRHNGMLISVSYIMCHSHFSVMLTGRLGFAPFRSRIHL